MLLWSSDEPTIKIFQQRRTNNFLWSELMLYLFPGNFVSCYCVWELYKDHSDHIKWYIRYTKHLKATFSRWVCSGWNSMRHGNHECMAPSPSVMSDSTEILFLRVPSNNRNICFLCVKSKSNEILSMSVSRWQEIFLIWKGRRHWGQVESTPLVFGI